MSPPFLSCIMNVTLIICFQKIAKSKSCRKHNRHHIQSAILNLKHLVANHLLYKKVLNKGLPGNKSKLNLNTFEK